MIQLTYGNLRDPDFCTVARKLFTFNGFDIKTAHRLMKINLKIDKEVAKMQTSFEEIAKKYALKDDLGNIVPVTGKDGKPVEGTFQVDKNLESEWTKELEAFKATTFDIDNEPVQIEKLEPARMSATELSAVQAFFKA